MIRQNLLTAFQELVISTAQASIPPFLLGLFVLWKSSFDDEMIRETSSSSTTVAFMTVFVFPTLTYGVHCLRFAKSDGHRSNTPALPPPLSAKKRARNETTNKYEKNNADHLTMKLPPDNFIHICLYLHPREIITLACVNQTAREAIDGKNMHESDNTKKAVCTKTTTSNTLWKTLWYRDYSAAILDWNVGKEALKRSVVSHMNDNNQNHVKHLLDTAFQNLLTASQSYNAPMKRFYFEFAEAYIPYLLAAQNKSQNCLLGLHGHILNFTKFAKYHPGLDVEIRKECGGTDATLYFEDLPHSSVARAIAARLCVVVNHGCCSNKGDEESGCGLSLLLPAASTSKGSIGKTTATQDDFLTNSNTRPLLEQNDDDDEGEEYVFFNNPIQRKRNFYKQLLPTKFGQAPRRPETLHHTRKIFDSMKCRYERKFAFARRTGSSILHSTEDDNDESRGVSTRRNKRVHVYYDPFTRKWNGWYTNFAAARNNNASSLDLEQEEETLFINDI